MSKFFSYLVPIGLLFTLSVSVPARSEEQTSPLAITNVTIISPDLAEPQKNMAVIINKGQITAIVETSVMGDFQGEVIDAAGMYLTPGLMDSHAHTTHVPGFDYAGSPQEAKHPELVTAYHRQQPRSLLYHGVTQVLDPSPTPEWTKFTDGDIHPDLFRCGVLPNLGAYPQIPINRAIEAFPHFIMDPDSGYNMKKGLTADPTDHTPEAALKAIKESGAVCAKLYIEDGFGGLAHWPIPTDKLLGDIRRAADAHGLVLYAHANALDMVQIALRNNIDVLGHGMWNWQWPAEKGPAPLQETIDTIKYEGKGYIATFGVIDGLKQLTHENPLKDKRLNTVTPAALVKWYKTEDAQWFKSDLIAGFGPAADAATAYQAFEGISARGARVLAYLNEIGHENFVLGSDYPGSPSYAKQPGLSTLQEMEMMATAGLPLDKILAAATINGARMIGVDHIYGTIEVGKKANLLLLNENPLNSIGAWDTIDAVILGGRAIKRESLAAAQENCL
ncbi:MAG: amidohydrolase family protein [Kordiimonadaceae bacterium]|nr:amidohydrolase family protein [Kordiimonadaceae bacterium]MBO6567848.1 amidohydrolase family protein [Kordiimonadaceae bacterium]MBO6964422.1 amidohydrolase family protein [Kordiimonadaceae bacterium]